MRHWKDSFLLQTTNRLICGPICILEQCCRRWIHDVRALSCHTPGFRPDTTWMFRVFRSKVISNKCKIHDYNPCRMETWPGRFQGTMETILEGLLDLDSMGLFNCGDCTVDELIENTVREAWGTDGTFVSQNTKSFYTIWIAKGQRLYISLIDFTSQNNHVTQPSDPTIWISSTYSQTVFAPPSRSLRTPASRIGRVRRNLHYCKSFDVPHYHLNQFANVSYSVLHYQILYGAEFPRNPTWATLSRLSTSNQASVDRDCFAPCCTF